MTELTAHSERAFDSPWQIDFTKGGREKMLDYIVAFEVEVTALIGKSKLNQNRSAADRAGVVEQLKVSNADLAGKMQKIDPQ